jgi:hypothetical protein
LAVCFSHFHHGLLGLVQVVFEGIGAGRLVAEPADYVCDLTAKRQRQEQRQRLGKCCIPTNRKMRDGWGTRFFVALPLCALVEEDAVATFFVR